MMKLKFKIQQYQTDAVENVVKVFNGQPNKGLAEYVVDKGKTYEKDNGKLIEVKNIHFEEDSTGYKNGDIVLTKDELLKNIHQVQTENNIRLSNEVVDKLGHCQLDVEMETGTGKHTSISKVCLNSINCMDGLSLLWSYQVLPFVKV